MILAAAEIWTKTYYNNTVQEWLVSLGFILGSVIAAKVVYWFFSGIARKLTAKTDTNVIFTIIF